MDIHVQAEKAERLRKLHHGPHILVLPNAWDVASARLMEELGYPAIATTSAGVAASLGDPDAQRISRGEMLEVVAGIGWAVRGPVTAEMGAGFAALVGGMYEKDMSVVAARVLGLNMEVGAGAEE